MWPDGYLKKYITIQISKQWRVRTCSGGNFEH